jgi:hypothetical protein
VLTDPATVPNSQQHEQAVNAPPPMIVSWLQVRTDHSRPPTG